MEHETVIICKDGTVNSFISCVVAAANKKKAGEDVCVVFMDEALAAIADKKLRWSPGLEARADAIKAEMEKRNMTVELDGLIKMAKDAGVPLYANMGWVKILAISQPEGLEPLELKDFLDGLSKAKQVITM